MRRIGRLWGVGVLALALMAGCTKGSDAGEAPASAEPRDLENIDPKDLYDVIVEAPEGMRAGDEGKLTLAIRPKDGAFVKPETPLRGEVEASGAVRAEKSRFSFADNARVESRGPVFEIPVHAESAGEGELGVDLDFYICIAELCMKTGEDLRVTTSVQ